MKAEEPKPSVCLVLSSGGARGIAAIAVIEELEKRGYHISSITGSSIGAVVGGVYALGYMQEYKRWVQSFSKYDVYRLLDISISRQGLMRGERIFKKMSEFIPDQPIEQLPLKFRAVATDLGNKCEYVFDTGSLFHAMRASVSIPTVIPPLIHDGLTLIDGGVMNPLPINCAPRKEGELLVVVNMNAAIPYEPVRISAREEGVEQYQNEEAEAGFNLQIMTESVELMQDKMASLIMDAHQPDIAINISKDAATTFEFYRSEEMLTLGRLAFEKGYNDYLRDNK